MDMTLSTLENIQEIRKKIVDYLKKGQYKAGQQCLQILKSNLADMSPYLARNLADIANQIVDRQLKLDLLKEALDLRADDAFVLTSYGHALAKYKQFEDAFLMFKRALQIKQNSDIIFNVYAKALAENEQLEQAAQTFERALQINGKNPVTLANYGKLLLESEQYQKAVVILEKSLALNNHAMGLTHYGQALAALGKYEQAFEAFEQALQLNPKNRWLWSIYGEHLAKQNQLEKSKQIFERALQLNPQSIMILASYGKVLAKDGQPEKAIHIFKQALLIEPRDEQDAEIFEQLLLLEPTNTKLLADYGELLIQAKKIEKASQMFQKSLNIDPRNASAWSDYGRALAELGQLQAACDKFDRALQLKPDEVVILTAYAKVLLDYNQPYKAFRLLEQAKQIEPENVFVLNSYAQALVQVNRPHKALKIFERILEIEPENVIILNSYATTLAKCNHFSRSFQIFEQNLKINPNDIVTLNSYGTALAKNNQFDEAFRHFERSLNIEPNNIITLNNYSDVLADNDKLDEACQLLEHALEIEPNNTITLNQYGAIMSEQGRVENAKKIFEHSLHIEPDNSVTLIHYAVLLELDNKYEAALEILHKISLDRLNNHFKSYIYLNLGRLYYLIYQEKEGDRYFDLAIENYPSDDLTRIKAARHILAVRPYSKDGIKYLRKITIASPRYEQALPWLSLNLNLEAYFDMFKDKAKDNLKNADLFRKIIDHKIKNKLSVIKGFIERIRRGHPSQSKRLETLIEKIDQILEKMSELNKEEEATVTEMSHYDYEKQLEVLSQTGHKKADFINNKLAVIKSKVQRYMRRLNDDDAYYIKLSLLLKKIENTQKILNKLKSINEGVKIERRIFKVKDLFIIWKKEPIFKQARINLEIQNEEAEFYGDQLEIIDCITELVENASAHNPNQTDLTIEIMCKDVKGLPQHVGSPTKKDHHRVPNEKKYLAIIVSDNGVGVSREKKELIFLMNYTTSTTDGSGLGLFYIKKTVTAMKGYIVENRENKEDGSKSQGAKFEIYLPYNRGG